MSTAIRKLFGFTLSVAAFSAVAFAQTAAQDKHVQDIRAEQPQSVIAASPLCQRTRENPAAAHHRYKIDLATWEPTLKGLMEKSDVVILGTVTDSVTAVAPSGETAVLYIDVRVVHSWKGSQEVGDVLTYAMPTASLDCAPPVAGAERVFWESFSSAPIDAHRDSPLPHVLFLRQSKGEEAQLTPGLRLTGASGTQGSYIIGNRPAVTEEARTCSNFEAGGPEKCYQLLETSQAFALLTDYSFPAPYQKDAQIPISALLKQVQSAADSLSSVAQAGSGK
jgi:hypothetical protein